MAIYSIFQQTPLQMIFGDAGCWVIYFLIIAHNTKAILGIGHYLSIILIIFHYFSATENKYVVKGRRDFKALWIIYVTIRHTYTRSL